MEASRPRDTISISVDETGESRSFSKDIDEVIQYVNSSLDGLTSQEVVLEVFWIAYTIYLFFTSLNVE